LPHERLAAAVVGPVRHVPCQAGGIGRPFARSLRYSTGEVDGSFLHSAILPDVFVWIVTLASILCMLLRPRGIPEAYWVCGGAALLLLAGLEPSGHALRAAWEGRDVYLFLAGMMVLAELARVEHVFDWAAGAAATHAEGSPRRLFLLVYLVGIVVTACLSNDATAVVLTPAVLAVVRRARVRPRPYLLACALIANAASFLLPISNPANLVLFDGQLPPLTPWLQIFLLPSVAAILVTYACLLWLTRSDLRGGMEGEAEPAPLTSEGKLALWALVGAAVLLVACSAWDIPLGAPTCGAAFLAMAVAAWRTPRLGPRVIRGVSWAVLPLVAGLFVLVDALHSAGMTQFGLAGLQLLAGAPAWAAKLGSAFSVALLSNVMNNLPAGLMSGMALRHAHQTGLLAHAVLIGVDLGPNLSVTGSLATILWLIALRREKVELSAWEFLKVGAVAMPLAMLAGLLVLWN